MPGQRFVLHIGVMVLLAWVGPLRPCPAGAQSPEAPAPATAFRDDTIRVTLTVSGGISRGAYQAGVNWALVEMMRQSLKLEARRRFGLRNPYKLVAATGASAGNVNSTLSAIEWCTGGESRPPEWSLFWTLWVNTGWDQLFPDNFRDSSTRGSLYTRRYVDGVVFDSVRSRMRRAGAERCSVPLGITLTRLRPDSLPVNDQRTRTIWAKTQRLATIFEIGDNQGELEFRYADSLIWKNRRLGKVIVSDEMVEGTRRIDDRWMLKAISASGAYPVAFEPVRLSYYETDDLNGRRECNRIPCDRRSAVFLDGGVFDNNPLDLALGIYERLPGVDMGDPRTRVVYIDPDMHRWPVSEAQPKPQASDEVGRGVAAVLELASGVVPAAREYELQALARSLAKDSIQRAWIRVTTNSHQIVGSYLNSFGAFLGRPFREYDFYLGIYDGLQFVAQEFVCAPTSGTEDSPVSQECTSTALKRMITDGMLPLGPVAPRALTVFYNSEYHAALPLPPAEALPPLQQQQARLFGRPSFVLPSLPTSPEARSAVLEERARGARMLLLDAMLRAGLARSHAKPTTKLDCEDGAWDERLICAEGFAVLLDSVAGTPGVKQEVAFWARLPECAPRNWPTSPDICPADAVLADLLWDRRVFTVGTIDRLFHQLWRIEDSLHENPNTRLAAHETGLETVGLLYYAVARRHPVERGLELDPSSIQTVHRHRGQRIAQGLPYTLSFYTNGGGFEVGYRPTLNLWPRFALVAPVNTGYRPAQGRFESALGVGALLRTRWVAFSGVDLSWQPVLSLKHGGETVARWVAFSSSGYLLADKLRIGVRYVSEAHPAIQRDDHWMVTLGLSDFNGLLYWFNRRWN